MRKGYATILSKIIAVAGLPPPKFASYGNVMTRRMTGTIAVIFIAQRTADYEIGYAVAAAAMDELAARQPGYCGVDSTRGPDGLGITVSYWEDEESAKAWRDHPEHAAIRDRGRGRWYSRYDLHVAAVTRSYDWQKP